MSSASNSDVASSSRTTCCIAGGGPAGMVLGYLLARQGIDVTLLEAHADFDREFRGDTIHSSVMEIMADLDLADEILAICHARLAEARVISRESSRTIASFDRLRSAFPYIAMVPQADFLALLAARAQQTGCFRLLMEANVQSLLYEDGNPGKEDKSGEVLGVVYRHEKRLHELRAALTIGADGRSSRVRRESGLELRSTAPPMDVIWFRIARSSEDGSLSSAALRFGNGALLVLLDRKEYWQAGYVVVKGSFRELRRDGIEAFRQRVLAVMPSLADRIEILSDFSSVSVLPVQTGRLDRWYLPGLLLIGDAAHVMSPIGGIGINYAIHDAVATANQLTEPLRNGTMTDRDLASVQRRRELPTAVAQRFQSFIQRRVVAAALRSQDAFQLPWMLRFAIRFALVRRMLARFIAFGLRPERVRYLGTPEPYEPSTAESAKS